MSAPSILPRAVFLLFCLSLTALTSAVQADERDDFFEAKIRPVLVGTCFRCHGDAKTSGELRVDSREALLKGGASGPAIVASQPEESLLIRAIERQADVVAMPPEKSKALRAEQVADFKAWIQAGVVWPTQSAKFASIRHWAFEPITAPAEPTVRNRDWSQTSVDRFILAKQELSGVHPASRADKLTLIRRVTFDLTGLPPTSEQVDAFLADESPQAFATVVDRLLKSPAYGERWGRHWLDVVRYADTAGETADYPVPLAWRYRNYVIDSFNADKPYDEFLREQIAGDVLAGQTPADRYAERVTATGYLAISRRFGFDSENYHHLTIQDTIDTLGQSVLGLSLGCARCHDHKFDPVTMHDYYALFGIFDSTRYSFPGSEQKPRVRSMVPLVPPSESQPRWRAYEARVAALAESLAKRKQPASSAVLRSLTDIDGDFELQAPAAGGSNGVLVPPWLYEGKIAVTTAAQSPFRNLYSLGRVGASVGADIGRYRIAQAIHPRRSAPGTDRVFVNLDFHVAAPDPGFPGAHRFTVGAIESMPLVEVLITSESVSLRSDGAIEKVAALAPNQWHNLQLAIDLGGRNVSGRVGRPGAVTEFANKPTSPSALPAVDLVTLDSFEAVTAKPPAIEYDNLGVQDVAIPEVSTELPATVVQTAGPDPVALNEKLKSLTGIDGDFELQTKDSAPASPWNPGPNSVVKLTTNSQSPFRNIYGPGELGIHMPNRGEYDGFGLTLPAVKPDAEGKLFVGFDFRCAGQEAGGNGSWRYYLGHGPGSSAAVELFFNAKEFFRRSGDAKETVSPLAVGEWYQVQMTLDLQAKTYIGTITSRTDKREFGGQLANGWDGAIDYSFIDSYGHIGGIRPALDADNFVIRDKSLPPFDAQPISAEKGSGAGRREQVAEIRRQLADLGQHADRDRQELENLLANGPFPLTYGMSEGTPHNVRTQMRGEPDQPGVEVPRGFIKLLGGGSLPVETRGSGRLELANWITQADNPLTARVMVNRVWQYHFGRGLVKTPNDFGVRGMPPTHPELLDHLATQFIKSGWSLKALHRLIVLSATYQQSSLESRPTDGVDTSALGNHSAGDLYVGFTRRRLSAEEIRDAILSVSGELDVSPAREHPFPSPISFGFSQHGPFNAVYDHKHRSVYLMTQRLKRHPFLALFDGADPNASTADRLDTTVPTQALYFLNDPFIHTTAERWAVRLLGTAAEEPKQIELAWKSACGRQPTQVELREAGEFLATYRTELTALQIDNVPIRALAAYLRTLIGGNEFLHVD